MAEASRSRGVKLTPVMQQYFEIKKDHEDAILFFRLGDFYEMFFDDAEKASAILDIALTSRNRSDPSPIPLCGVPYHSARPYIARLLEAGLKVAICEQIDLPEGGRTIVRRKVTRVVTPGTLLDDDSLAPERGNFLAAVCGEGSDWGLAWTDFSTGELRATRLSGRDGLRDELTALGPSEVLVAAGFNDSGLDAASLGLTGCMISAQPRETEASSELWRRVGVADLPKTALEALSVLLGYIEATQGEFTGHLRPVEYYDTEAFLGIDSATRRNLELTTSLERDGKTDTLLAVVDQSVTPMGKRLAGRWIENPLADLAAIGERLDAVEAFLEEFELRDRVRQILKSVGDLERLAGKVGSRTARPRDLVQLELALRGIAELCALVEGRTLPESLRLAFSRLDSQPALRALIGQSIVAEPPAQLAKGGVIRDGFNEEVDRLRSISRDGKGWIAAFEREERERSGISGLKVGYNKVFGYYLEVSKSNLDRVPPDYQRKQTLVNAERFVTPELKKCETEVLGAEERLSVLEAHLFAEIVDQVAQGQAALVRSAVNLAFVDVVAGFAETAHVRHYVRPEVHRGLELQIIEGRHPVVEAVIGKRFVPNDCRLDPERQLVAVITGPNMAGKSTFLRQVALIALLAHCGSFVPAASARIPLLDRVFTRIGASDNLSAGQSTFMVEMTETANILRNMSTRSLVVLDEIGRGTSTFDGISIAWAVAEAMLAGGVKTLFATHYHELAGLASEHDLVVNRSVAVRRYKGSIVFLYRVVEGAASGSYGIEVARLAGVPDGVTEKAEAILKRFEERPRAGDVDQMGLFSQPSAEAPEAWEAAICKEIAAVDADTLSPLEALNLLDGLVRRVRKVG